MRDAHRRLERLESQHSDHSARRVVVAPIAGDSTPLPAVGYECADVVTLCEPGETEAACWDRHSAALDGKHGPAKTTISRHLINPEVTP